MADAASLHCPNCGAIAAPAARSCPYCRARLATVSCGSCFALIFEGGEYCPRCGARRSRVDLGGDPVTCPGCRGGMTPVQVGDEVLLECAGCAATWVDAAEFERICADREGQRAVLHRWSAPRAAPFERTVRYRPCLRCGKMMNRVNFGRMSGTIVDVCRGDGTFLDAGELHQIVSFIQAGGLDRARDRQLEDLREQERRLQEAESRAARTRGAADPHAAIGLPRGGWDGGTVQALLAMLRGDRQA